MQQQQPHYDFYSMPNGQSTSSSGLPEPNAPYPNGFMLSHMMDMPQDDSNFSQQGCDMGLPSAVHDQDDGLRSTAAGKRPKLSLASLIGQAILSSPGQKARLSTVYMWISHRYPEYYKLNCGGWQVRWLVEVPAFICSLSPLYPPFIINPAVNLLRREPHFNYRPYHRIISLQYRPRRTSSPYRFIATLFRSSSAEFHPS